MRVGAAGGQRGWVGSGQHRPGLSLAGVFAGRPPGVLEGAGACCCREERRSWQKEPDRSVRKGGCPASCSPGTLGAPEGPGRASPLLPPIFVTICALTSRCT